MLNGEPPALFSKRILPPSPDPTSVDIKSKRASPPTRTGEILLIGTFNGGFGDDVFLDRDQQPLSYSMEKFNLIQTLPRPICMKVAVRYPPVRLISDSEGILLRGVAASKRSANACAADGHNQDNADRIPLRSFLRLQ